MHEIEKEIALLELRSEQLVIHLKQVQQNYPESVAVRAELRAMLERLVVLKDMREQLLDEGRFAA
jgi:hypothetical protein